MPTRSSTARSPSPSTSSLTSSCRPRDGARGARPRPSHLAQGEVLGAPEGARTGRYHDPRARGRALRRLGPAAASRVRARARSDDGLLSAAPCREDLPGCSNRPGAKLRGPLLRAGGAKRPRISRRRCFVLLARRTLELKYLGETISPNPSGEPPR